MDLQKIIYDFSVCKLKNVQSVDLNGEFIFLSKTDDEISLVCKSESVPDSTIACEPGWRALKICGILDFGMTGVISKISGILAQAGIAVFVVSTYNTDYIFLKGETLEDAVQVLGCGGYVIRQ